MKYSIIGHLIVFFILASTPLAKAVPASGGAPTADKSPNPLSGSVIKDTILMPVQEELSQSGRETLAYLMFVQAIFDEDEAALLEAAPLLSESDTPAEVWLDGGVWLMSRKSPNAIVFLEQARKKLPEDMSLLLLYAEALGEHDMADRGVALMRDFLKTHPDSLDAKIELALLLVKDHKYSEAQKILSGITGKQRTPLVDFYQGEALMGMDKRGEAIPFYRKAVKGMPDFSEALAKLAFLLEREGNFKEARTTYEKLLKQHFSPQQVALRLIDISLRLKQPEKALHYARQGPDTQAFKIAAANLFMESRHFLQAETILKQIASQPGAPVEVYLYLADLVYEQRKNLKLALDWLGKIPPDTPGIQRAPLMEAQLMVEAGKPAEALAAIDKAMAKYPDMPEFADFRVRILARLKKSAEALDAARLAHAKWPDNTEIAFLLGSLLDEAGDKKAAMEIMESIIKKSPDHFQALNYIGFTLADENREISRALELLKRANELAPNQAFILDSLAWAYYRANLLDDAMREIRLAVAKPDTADPAIWEHYGDISAKMGKREEARKAYRKALEFKPANSRDLKTKLTGL